MIKTKYYDGLSVVVHIGAGDITVQDIIDTAVGWWEHENYAPEVPVVWDFIDANLQLSFDDVRAVDDGHIERVNTHRPGGRTAWVVPNELARALVEGIHQSQSWSTEWRAFTEPEAAIDWARGVD